MPKLSDLPKEVDWFRPPSFLAFARYGDYEQYGWIAEPAHSEGVYGVCYRISMDLFITIKDTNFFDKIKQVAKEELYHRIETDSKHGEGEKFETFLWEPVITRHEDGTISITRLSNLYNRPGRFLLVYCSCDQCVEKGNTDSGELESGSRT